jgi:hypothetical protein
MSADKYAEAMDFLAKRGYGQLAPFAEQARKDAQGEQTRKVLCWLLGVVGGVVGVFGVGDGIGRSVRAWKQRRSVSGIDDSSASQPGTDEN